MTVQVTIKRSLSLQRDVLHSTTMIEDEKTVHYAMSSSTYAPDVFTNLAKELNF